MDDYIPRSILSDARLDRFRAMPFDNAWSEIIEIWSKAPSLFSGPGPLGTKEIPLESQFCDWLVYEHPESEARFHAELGNSSLYVRAYCLHALIRMYSRLLLDLPDDVLKCEAKLNSVHGCSVGTTSFRDHFDQELRAVWRFHGIDVPESDWERWRRALDEVDAQWPGKPRACPRCGSEFVSNFNRGQCPKCGHLFFASNPSAGNDPDNRAPGFPPPHTSRKD